VNPAAWWKLALPLRGDAGDAATVDLTAVGKSVCTSSSIRSSGSTT
jgi:hypothetical protein